MTVWSKIKVMLLTIKIVTKYQFILTNLVSVPK